MKLIELEPRFLKRLYDTSLHKVNCMAKADLIDFICPVCSDSHHIRIPLNGRAMGKGWDFKGSDFNDLTLTPSIAVMDNNCKAHFFIINGEIKF